jgi:hypothetical protein
MQRLHHEVRGLTSVDDVAAGALLGSASCGPLPRSQ